MAPRKTIIFFAVALVCILVLLLVKNNNPESLTLLDSLVTSENSEKETEKVSILGSSFLLLKSIKLTYIIILSCQA